MLTIEVEPKEVFNEELNEFQTFKGMTLQLEHSLLSLSKWEMKWKKSFLNTEKNNDESLDYIRCMTITHNVPEYIYYMLTQDHINKIGDYIQDSMTATTINLNQKSGPKQTIVTAELIYYWMIALNIPMEFEKWHLNRLMTLIQVCSIESAPKKKMSKREIMSQNKSLNAARKARLNTAG